MEWRQIKHTVFSEKCVTDPADTGRNLNVHKTFRRRPGCLLNILCTFTLRPVSTGLYVILRYLISIIKL